jgi:hypothetical protein
MAKKSAAGTVKPAGSETSASVQVLPLPAGLYLFSVSAGSPGKLAGTGGLRLPALNVAVGPGVPSERVQFMPGQASNGTWLSAPGDLLVVKVNSPGATLLVNSVRGTGGAKLEIKLDKLDGQAIPATVSPPPAAVPAPAASRKDTPRIPGLRLKTNTHVRTRGDLSFVDVEWAGRVGPGMWIESFSVTPLERFTAQDIEYKGLTASGFESPWLSNGVSCGTRGMAIPLIGFAVRLKAGVGDGEYDCVYSGYFQSGVVVGPLKNGTPCLSTVANDPLEGIQIRLIKKGESTEPAAARKTASPPRNTPATARKTAKRVVKAGKSARKNRR